MMTHCGRLMGYRKIITIEPGKRGGKPCIRGLRITVGDVLGWVAAGMSRKEIIEDFPDLTEAAIQRCHEYTADREQHTTSELTLSKECLHTRHGVAFTGVELHKHFQTVTAACRVGFFKYSVRIISRMNSTASWAFLCANSIPTVSPFTTGN